MAATAWTFYNSFKDKISNGIVLETDAFKMALFLSTSNCADATQTTYAGLTNQHANANGYTTGGVALTGTTWGQTAGTATFDAPDAAWTASGGNIVARYAVIYDVTTGDLVCYCLMDDAPADVTVPAGNTLTVEINISGVFTLAG